MSLPSINKGCILSDGYVMQKWRNKPITKKQKYIEETQTELQNMIYSCEEIYHVVDTLEDNYHKLINTDEIDKDKKRRIGKFITNILSDAIELKLLLQECEELYG